MWGEDENDSENTAKELEQVARKKDSHRRAAAPPYYHDTYTYDASADDGEDEETEYARAQEQQQRRANYRHELQEDKQQQREHHHARQQRGGGELPIVEEHVHVKNGKLKYKKSSTLGLECANLVFFVLGTIGVAGAACMFALAEYNTNLIYATSLSTSADASSAFSGTITCSQQIPLPVMVTSNTYPYKDTFSTQTNVGNITHADWWEWVLIGFGFYAAGFCCFLVVSILSRLANSKRDSNVRMQGKNKPQHKDLKKSLRNCPVCCLTCFKTVSCCYRFWNDFLKKALVYFIVVSVMWFGAILLFYFLYGVNSSVSFGPANTMSETINSGLFVTFAALPAGCTAPLSLNVIQTETITNISGTVNLSGNNATLVPWWGNFLIMIGAILLALFFLFGWYKAFCVCCMAKAKGGKK